MPFGLVQFLTQNSSSTYHLHSSMANRVLVYMHKTEIEMQYCNGMFNSQSPSLATLPFYQPYSWYPLSLLPHPLCPTPCDAPPSLGKQKKTGIKVRRNEAGLGVNFLYVTAEGCANVLTSGWVHFKKAP